MLQFTPCGFIARLIREPIQPWNDSERSTFSEKTPIRNRTQMLAGRIRMLRSALVPAGIINQLFG